MCVLVSCVPLSLSLLGCCLPTTRTVYIPLALSKSSHRSVHVRLPRRPHAASASACASPSRPSSTSPPPSNTSQPTHPAHPTLASNPRSASGSGSFDSSSASWNAATCGFERCARDEGARSRRVECWAEEVGCQCTESVTLWSVGKVAPRRKEGGDCLRMTVRLDGGIAPGKRRRKRRKKAPRNSEGGGGGLIVTPAAGRGSEGEEPARAHLLPVPVSVPRER